MDTPRVEATETQMDTVVVVVVGTVEAAVIRCLI